MVMKSKNYYNSKRSAQDMQDEIFRIMSADEKIKLGAGLWRLAKELDSSKITYGTIGSKRFIGANNRNS